MQARDIKSITTAATFEAVGINEVEWQIFRQNAFWSREDAQQAIVTLSKAMALGFQLAGVPRIGIIAEHVACVIQVFVQPVNWGVLCSLGASGLDGTKLLPASGEDVQNMETMSAERLHALVMAASDLSSRIFRDTESVEDREMAS